MPFLLTGTEAFLDNSLYQFKPNGQGTPQRSIQSRWNIRTASPKSPVGCSADAGSSEWLSAGAQTWKARRLYTRSRPLLGVRDVKARAKNFGRVSSSLSPDRGRRSPRYRFDAGRSACTSRKRWIGDHPDWRPNQAIFEFCGADGSYLRDYPARTGVVPKKLTMNFRSVPRIVNAANSLAHRSDTAHRPEPATDNGAFFLPFGKGEEGKLIARFRRQYAQR